MTVFVYGTLRDPGVLNAVLGHDNAAAVPGCVEGYVARLALGHHFPMLRPMPDGRAEGLLLTNLNDADIAALDAFEGETYRRQPMTVILADGSVTADIYIDDGSYDDGGPFDLAVWESHHRDRFISSFMELRGFDRPV
ncbi:MAG: gamma-glutamylcyclotransferase family protein [Candidatus Puniceispirillales bacterium]